MKVGKIIGINNFIISSLLIILVISQSGFSNLRVLLITCQIIFFSIAIIAVKRKVHLNFGVFTLSALFVYIIIQNIVLQTELIFVFQSILMVSILILITQISALNSEYYFESGAYKKLSKILLFLYPLLTLSFTAWSQTSSPGLFNNPNITGHISIMIIPLILLGIYDKKKWIFYLWSLALVVVIITESRSTLMAWVLCLSIYLLVTKTPNINFIGVTTLVSLTTVLSAYAIDIATWLLFTSLNLAGTYNTRFLYLQYNGRDVIWEYALNRFYEEPLFGLGFGGAKFEIEGHVLDTHNGFLEILIRLGLIGTLIFLVYILNLCYMISKSHPSLKPALTVSVVAIMSLATNSSTFFVFNYLFLYVNIIVYASYVGSKKTKASRNRGSVVV